MKYRLKAFDMANLWPKHTGLKRMVWVDTSAGVRKINHNSYRIKYGELGNTITLSFFKEKVTVAGNSKDFRKSEIAEVIEWIISNRNNLKRLYDGEIDIYEFIENIIKVQG